jgi:hypothetical protein
MHEALLQPFNLENAGATHAHARKHVRESTRTREHARMHTAESTHTRTHAHKRKP